MPVVTAAWGRELEGIVLNWVLLNSEGGTCILGLLTVVPANTVLVVWVLFINELAPLDTCCCTVVDGPDSIESAPSSGFDGWLRP